MHVLDSLMQGLWVKPDMRFCMFMTQFLFCNVFFPLVFLFVVVGVLFSASICGWIMVDGVC